MQKFFVMAAALTLAIGSSAFAVPLFDVDFNGETVGALPSEAAYVPGAVNTQAQQVDLEPSDGSLAVADGALGLGGSGDLVVVGDQSANYAWGARFEGQADAATNGQVVVGMDFSAERMTSGSERVSLKVGNENGMEMGELKITVDTSGEEDRTWLRYVEKPYPVTGYFQHGFLDAFEWGVPSRIELIYDLDANTVQIAVDGNILTSEEQSKDTFSTFDESIWRVHVSSEKGRHAFAFDNVTVTPEPASMALLGLGGLAILRRRSA
jgi:hypothetical protein